MIPCGLSRWLWRPLITLTCRPVSLLPQTGSIDDSVAAAAAQWIIIKELCEVTSCSYRRPHRDTTASVFRNNSLLLTCSSLIRLSSELILVRDRKAVCSQCQCLFVFKETYQSLTFEFKRWIILISLISLLCIDFKQVPFIFNTYLHHSKLEHWKLLYILTFWKV